MFLHLTTCKKTAFKQMTVCKQETIYLCKIELFEVELFDRL